MQVSVKSIKGQSEHIYQSRQWVTEDTTLRTTHKNTPVNEITQLIGYFKASFFMGMGNNIRTEATGDLFSTTSTIKMLQIVVAGQKCPILQNRPPLYIKVKCEAAE